MVYVEIFTWSCSTDGGCGQLLQVLCHVAQLGHLHFPPFLPLPNRFPTHLSRQPLLLFSSLYPFSYFLALPRPTPLVIPGKAPMPHSPPPSPADNRPTKLAKMEDSIDLVSAITASSSIPS